MARILQFEDYPRAKKSGKTTGSNNPCQKLDPEISVENITQATGKNAYTVLLDVTLPSARELPRREDTHGQSDVRILVLSAQRKNELSEKTNRIGGYRQRVFYDPEEVVERIKATLQQQAFLDKSSRIFAREESMPSKITWGPLTLDLVAMVAQAEGRNMYLTPREFALLLALVRARGECLSAEALYHIAWGMGALDDNRAVRIQISRLRAKLGQLTAKHVEIVAQRGIGYRLRVVNKRGAD